MDADLARGRALSSPVRMRILRVCLHTARTNKEIAERLALDPGTCLHHVRTLVDNGFLAAQQPRRGRRNAIEIPYLATRLSWHTPSENMTPTLVGAFVQEVGEVDPHHVWLARLGLKLNADHRAELLQRLDDLIQEFACMGPDDDGEALSLFVAEHPDPKAD